MAFGLYVRNSMGSSLQSMFHGNICQSLVAMSLQAFLWGFYFQMRSFIGCLGFMTTEQLIDYGWRLPFFIAAILSAVPLLAWRLIS